MAARSLALWLLVPCSRRRSSTHVQRPMNISSVLAVERLIDSAHTLHVLPRHRLLLKADVGERALAIPVEHEPRHLSAANMEHVRPLHLDVPDLHPARLSSPAEVHKHEHPLLVERAVLVGLGAQTLKGVQALRATPLPSPPPQSSFRVSGRRR